MLSRVRACRRGATLGVLVLGIAAVVVGCGPGEDSDSASSAKGTPTAKTVTAARIR